MPNWPPRRCRAPACREVMEPGVYWCEPHESDLLQRMMCAVDIRAENSAFYIGRTNWPERRLLVHRRDREVNSLAVLHWAGDQGEVEALESVIIKVAMERHGVKCLNRAAEPFGAWYGDWYCIYIAWRRAGNPHESAVVVSELDVGKRTCPDREFAKKLAILYTPLSQDAAAKEVAIWGTPAPTR